MFRRPVLVSHLLVIRVLFSCNLLATGEVREFVLEMRFEHTCTTTPASSLGLNITDYKKYESNINYIKLKQLLSKSFSNINRSLNVQSPKPVNFCKF